VAEPLRVTYQYGEGDGARCVRALLAVLLAPGQRDGPREKEGAAPGEQPGAASAVPAPDERYRRVVSHTPPAGGQSGVGDA